MKVVLDEDIPCSFREVFEEFGFSVIDTHDTPLRGHSDTEIFRFAQQEQAILITGDKNFLHIVSVLKRPHAGLVIIRFPSTLSIGLRRKELYKLLAHISQEDLKRNIVMIRPGKLRIRRNILRG